MQKIARFEKVSREQFVVDWKAVFGDNSGADASYGRLSLPHRATVGSAGYDFYMPFDLELAPGQTARIPTGIRVSIEEGWVLMIYPRSGLGFKYRLQLNNTVGVIDSDYYYSGNEGHIFIKITNDSNEGRILSLKEGDGFAQGIFTPFGLTVDDDTDGIRDGGFGSTSSR